MLEKNKARLARKERATWNGLYTRKTPTRKERAERIERKHRGRAED